MNNDAGSVGQTPGGDSDVADATVFDSVGEKVGTVARLIRSEAGLDYATVKTGWFGLRVSVIPLGGARIAAGEVHVPFTKDQIKDAPHVDDDGAIDAQGREELAKHYGLGAGVSDNPPREAPAPSGEPAADRTATYGSEATADDISSSWTESEPVGTEEEETDDLGGMPVEGSDGPQEMAGGDSLEYAARGDAHGATVDDSAEEGSEGTGRHRDPAGPHALNQIHPYEPSPGEHLGGGEEEAEPPPRHRVDEVDRSTYEDDQPVSHEWAYEGSAEVPVPDETPVGSDPESVQPVNPGYQDRDGTDLTDEERARLNQARGNL